MFNVECTQWCETKASGARVAGRSVRGLEGFVCANFPCGASCADRAQVVAKVGYEPVYVACVKDVRFR